MKHLYPSLCSKEEIKSLKRTIDMIKGRASIWYHWDLNFPNDEKQEMRFKKIFLMVQELGQIFTYYFIQ